MDMDSISDVECAYGESSRKGIVFIVILTVCTLAAFLVSLCIGPVTIGVEDVLRSIGHSILPNLVDGPDKAWYQNIVINGRMSRSLLCILCGISLGISGAVMQNILRNPLVSPFTLGVSSAASFGAAMAIVFGSTLFGSFINGSFELLGMQFMNENLIIVLFAFLSGMLSIAIVIMLSRRKGISRSTIILAGVIISYLFQAGVSLAKYISTDDALREITLWLMGGMWNASWSVDIILIPIVIASFAVLESMSMKVNILSAGEEVAESLGVRVSRLRTAGLVISTLVTSACLAFTGVIGFIGLMAPHICRMFIGNDCRFLFPAASVLGALILIVSDTVARVVISPEELPVGIIMYIIGGIFFIWLISRRNKEVNM
ncbi:MAG: FecCD family ABC transporter permease [Candidatus Methanomethylophilaceae archaeon]